MSTSGAIGPARSSARTDERLRVTSWYSFGVLLPLALTVTSPFWWSSIAESVGAPTLNTPGVAWMLGAGWVPWLVSAWMAAYLAAKFSHARERHDSGAVGWHRTSVGLLLVTGAFGALFSISLLGIASMFGHPGGPQMGP